MKETNVNQTGKQIIKSIEDNIKDKMKIREVRIEGYESSEEGK